MGRCSGFFDRTLASHLLLAECGNNGLLLRIGEDAVQAIIDRALDDGERAAAKFRAAEEDLEKTDLERMNERFAVVKVGGKTRVMEFQEFPARRGAPDPGLLHLPRLQGLPRQVPRRGRD